MIVKGFPVDFTEGYNLTDGNFGNWFLFKERYKCLCQHLFGVLRVDFVFHDGSPYGFVGKIVPFNHQILKFVRKMHKLKKLTIFFILKIIILILVTKSNLEKCRDKQREKGEYSNGQEST